MMSQTATTVSMTLPILSMWRREVVRFLRQRSRIVGALGTPIVFWLLIGSGLRDSFRVPGAADSTNYLEYAFPGTIVLILLFTAIFATISIIEDRREGFLQAVLVAPVPRSAIVLGKVLGSATLALGQAVLFLLLAPLLGVSLTLGSALAVLGVLAVMAVGLSALGFLIAWQMDSSQGYHSVMNLFLLPMWLLSGAFFPATGASGWLRWVMAVNPLTYGVAALRQVLYMGDGGGQAGLPSLPLSLGVMIGFSVLMVVLAARSVAKSG